jgi:hypothetical protein
MGLRGKVVKTTQADPDKANPRDLVKNQFTTERPDQLRVADFTGRYLPMSRLSWMSTRGSSLAGVSG